jgi:hypothetical protein
MVEPGVGWVVESFFLPWPPFTQVDGVFSGRRWVASVLYFSLKDSF